MRDVARKGDLAYVLRHCIKDRSRAVAVTENDRRSRIVKVLTDPEEARDLKSFDRGDIINHCELPSGIRGWVKNIHLVPIRNPDADAVQTTRVQESA